MKKMRHAAIIALFIALPVFAQDPAEEDTLRTFELKEIVVTATRGGGEVLQVPMAVGIVTARDFFSSRRIGLNDALWAMPGVLVQSRAGGQDVRLTIRGFGARGNGDRSNAAIVRGIKILVDGFPETEPDGRTALDLVDLAAAKKIEVVRSNASTLFGNASGGVVNVETMPLFAQPYAETHNIVGGYGLRKNNLSVGTTFGPGRFFLSATNSAFDGVRQNSRSQSTQINTAVTTEFDELTRFKLSASAAVNRFSIPGPLTKEQYETDPTQAKAVYAARQEQRYNRIARLGVQFNKEFAEEHSLEVLGYLSPKVLERSERGTYRDFNRLHFGSGIVYNWNGRGNNFLRHITAGVDGASQDGTILFYNLINGQRGDSLRTNKQEGAATLGAFLQADFKLAESVTVTLGGRFDWQIYISQDFAADVRLAGKREELTLNHFTPKAALLYRFSSNHSLYFNIGGGVEAPAFNEVDPPPSLTNVSLNQFLKPMTSTTVELGLKGIEQYDRSSFVQLLSYSVATYSITVNDEIVPYNGGEWFFSAGKSQRFGFETGGQLDFRGGWALKSALTYLRARYRTYSNELGDFAEKEVPGIAPLVFNTRIRYEAGNGFSAELGFEHVGSYFADDANTVKAPYYVILHGALGYAVRYDNIKIQGFLGVNNLTNQNYVASSFINPLTRSPDGKPLSPAFAEPGLPINAYAGVNIKVDL